MSQKLNGQETARNKSARVEPLGYNMRLLLTPSSVQRSVLDLLMHYRACTSAHARKRFLAGAHDAEALDLLKEFLGSIRKHTEANRAFLEEFMEFALMKCLADRYTQSLWARFELGTIHDEHRHTFRRVMQGNVHA
jgi:hypothetical protein